MKNISNNLLIETYIKAKKIKLDQKFCNLIKNEITNRGLLIESQRSLFDQNKKM